MTSGWCVRPGFAVFAWAIVLLLVPCFVRAQEPTAEELKPSLAFLGVNESGADEAGQHHALEVELIKLLQASGSWDLRTPELLDRELGRSNRILLLSSRVPGKGVPDYAKSIGAPHTLLAVAPRKNGENVTTLLLLNTSDGTTEAVETVHEGESFAEALQRFLRRARELDDEQLAHEGLTRRDIPSPPSERPPAAQRARIVHTPVTTGLENVPLVIEASVNCPVECHAVVYYRLRPSTEWLPAPLLPSKDRKVFRAALSPMPAGTVEYFINAADVDLNTLGMDGSEASPHVVRLLTSASARPVTAPLAAVAPREPLRRPVYFRTGLALVILSGAALVTGGIMLGLNHHESTLIHEGSLGTGAEISHAMQLSSSYYATGWSCGAVGLISGLAGGSLMLLGGHP